MRRHFTEKDTQKPNTHMKSCPVSLAVREMQVKTTVRSPYVPFRIATMKNNTENERGCGEARSLLYRWYSHPGKEFGTFI